MENTSIYNLYYETKNRMWTLNLKEISYINYLMRYIILTTFMLFFYVLL